MFLDHRQLEIFCAAAEELHFGRAAARVFMSQPPFSQQIKKIEALVGASLFERTTRSVRLTAAGQVMHARARQLADETQRMVRDVRRAARGDIGSLTIGLTPSASCSPLAEAFYRYRCANPGVELELREMNSVDMEGALRDRHLDVALMRPCETDADIDTAVVLREPMLLALRRDHPWASRRRINLHQVADEPLIGYEQARSPYFREMVRQMFRHIGRQPRIVQESIQPTVLTLVEAGLGAAIVPMTISGTRGDKLAFVSLQDPSKSQACIMLAALRTSPNPMVEGFASMLRESPLSLVWRGAGD